MICNSRFSELTEFMGVIGARNVVSKSRNPKQRGFFRSSSGAK